MVKSFEHAEHAEHADDAAFEDRVREALRREADTVEPSGHGLQAIRARTTRGGGGRARTRWFAGGAVLATAAAVAAIALAGSTDLGLGDAPDAAPAGPAASTQPLQIFYLDSTPERRGEPGSVTRDDPGLYREVHDVAVNGGGRVEAAVRELVDSTPTDRDYSNPWRDVTVHSVRADPARAVVDVSALPPAGPAQDAALQALAHTVQAATATPRVVTVTVRVDGETARRFGAADPLGTYAGIWVTNPEQGAAAASPVRFSGMAATFEANVVYEIRRAQQVVARGFTTATGGAGVWSPWSFTERLRPGAYTVVTFDQDPALGGRRDIDTKDFTVR